MPSAILASWTPVCTGDEAVATVEAHLGTAGGDSCSTESVSYESCLETVQTLLPEGATQADATLNDGSWTHVPQGCSMNHENYRALWNGQTDAISNNGQYTPVCTGDEAVATVGAHLGTAGGDSCSTESVSYESCLETVQTLLPEGATQADATLNDGSWTHVPQGCSMNHENYRALWNGQTDAISNTGSWTPVCAGEE